jgi:type I restriction enzyme S subunit
VKAGWTLNRLGDILQVQNGYAFDSKAFGQKGVPLIRIRDLKDGTTTETYFSGDFDAKYVVNSGDFLIGMDGEFGCYEWKGSPALLNQRVCRLQGFSVVLEPRFLFYGINSHLKDIEAVTGYTTVKHLSSKQILEITMPTPPLPEQQRIVAILDQAFAAIATARAHAEQNLQNARAVFDSHLQAVFSQRGDGWETVRLSEACLIRPPKSEARQKLDAQAEVSFVPMEDLGIGQKYLEPKKTRLLEDVAGSYTYFADGDVLLAKITPCFENGKLGIARGLKNGVGFGSSEYIVLRPDAKTSPEFIYYYLARAAFFEEGAGKMSGAVGHKRVSKEFIENYPIPVPPLSEQQQIIATLDALREQTQALASLYQRKIAALDALKQSLLHQAFSGAL